MSSTNKAVVLLGSNIRPAENLGKAVAYLRQLAAVRSLSNIWETKAVGGNGPNFLNMAAEVETTLAMDQFKTEVIDRIESELKRIRTANKNAPRTIDLDIILFNNKVLDNNLWDKAFIAIPVAEIYPDLPNPAENLTLREIAERLKNSAFVRLYNQTKD